MKSPASYRSRGSFTRNLSLVTRHLIESTLRRIVQPRLTGQHGLRYLHHRNRTILARALEDAIGLLLRRASAAHENTLRPFDRFSILERLLCGLGILARVE